MSRKLADKNPPPFLSPSLLPYRSPEEYQTVAGGRNAVETPGSGWIGPCILEGCQSAATPAGSTGNLGRRSGGVAALDPRLPSGKPPACFPADLKTNERPPADAGTGVCLRTECHRPGAPDPERTADGRNFNLHVYELV